MNELRENPNYFSIIPATIRYCKDLSAQEKLLYSEITALTNAKGYCWATNNYFADLYNLNKKSVSRQINNLAEHGFIRIELIYVEDTKQIQERRIHLSTPDIHKIINDTTTPTSPIHKNADTPIHKNVEDNNTRNINKKINNKSINQRSLVDNMENETIDTIDNRRTIENTVKQNISLDTLSHNYPTKQKEITELYKLIVEILASRKTSFRIAKEELSASVVKEAFSKLNPLHIEYVLQCLKSTTTAVKSTKAYLLTSLYNAANTMNNHYSLAVQHQLSENPIYQPR